MLNFNEKYLFTSPWFFGFQCLWCDRAKSWMDWFLSSWTIAGLNCWWWTLLFRLGCTSDWWLKTSWASIWYSKQCENIPWIKYWNFRFTFFDILIRTFQHYIASLIICASIFGFCIFCWKLNEFINISNYS